MEIPTKRVVFDSPDVELSLGHPETQTSLITGLVIKFSRGQITTSKQAQYVLVALTIICVTITILLMIKTLKPSVSRPSPEKIIQVAS